MALSFMQLAFTSSRTRHTTFGKNSHCVFQNVFTFAGDSLLWVPEDQAVHDGHGPVRRMLPERGAGGCGTLPATVRHHRNQDVQQYVHVPRLPRSQTHLP